MPRRFPWVAVALCGALGACKTAQPAQPGPSTPPSVTAPVTPKVKPKPLAPPEVERWGALAVELAAALDRAGRSCAAVAKVVRSFADQHAAELASTRKALVAWENDASLKELDAYYERYFAAIEVRIDAGIRCKDDPAAKGAFDRFFAAAGLDRPSP